jgi:phosphatidylglycerol:prolipoprotein diacylglycerol transferase
MHPVLLRLGPLTIHTYGVLIATGILLALWFARRRAPKYGLDPDRVWNVGIYMVLAALVGAKVWYVAEGWKYYAANPREIFSVATLQAAGTWYGGVFTALLVAVFYVRRYKLGLLPLLDTLGIPLSLGHGIGRLGCFSAGCCWGKPTAAAWGVTFTDPYAAQTIGTPLGTALHPTQLYEATAEFTILAFLLWLDRRQKFSGQIFATYFMLYGVARFTIEFFRGDPGRTMLFDGRVSLMQVVSLLMVALGVWIWLKRPAAPALATAPAKKRA